MLRSAPDLIVVALLATGCEACTGEGDCRVIAGPGRAEGFLGVGYRELVDCAPAHLARRVRSPVVESIPAQRVSIALDEGIDSMVLFARYQGVPEDFRLDEHLRQVSSQAPQPFFEKPFRSASAYRHPEGWPDLGGQLLSHPAPSWWTIAEQRPGLLRWVQSPERFGPPQRSGGALYFQDGSELFLFVWSYQWYGASGADGGSNP